MLDLEGQKTLEELEEAISREKEHQFRLLQQKEKHFKENKLHYFVPHSMQVPFFENSNRLRRAAFCGNRWGKSTVGVVEDVSWLIGERPFYPVGHPLRRKGIPEHGVKGILIAEDWDKVNEVFTNPDPGENVQGKFFEWLPASCEVETKRNQQGVIDRIFVESFIDGRTRRSAIFFDTVASFKRSGASQESSDWDFFHIDEPIPQELFTAIARGLIDRGGAVWALATMLKDVWLYWDFVEQVRNGNEQYFYLEGDMDDNPTLNETAKALFLSGLSPDEYACRKEGKPLAAGRRVLWAFDDQYAPAGHVIEHALPEWEWLNDYTPNPAWNTAYAIDPHPQTPHAVLFAAWNETDVVIYDELFRKGSFSDQPLVDSDALLLTGNNDLKHPSDVASLIASKQAQVRPEGGPGEDSASGSEHETGGSLEYVPGLATLIKNKTAINPPMYVPCDPSAWIKDQDSDRCWAQTLRENGIPVIKGSKAREAGIIEMNDLVSGRKGKRFWLMAHCNNFRQEAKLWVFDKDNKAIDKNDHMMECFRRLLVHDNFSFYPRFPEEVVRYSRRTIDDLFSNPDFSLPDVKHVI
jgi:hypothetical protein